MVEIPTGSSSLTCSFLTLLIHYSLLNTCSLTPLLSLLTILLNPLLILRSALPTLPSYNEIFDSPGHSLCVALCPGRCVPALFSDSYPGGRVLTRHRNQTGGSMALVGLVRACGSMSHALEGRRAAWFQQHWFLE